MSFVKTQRRSENQSSSHSMLEIEIHLKSNSSNLELDGCIAAGALVGLLVGLLGCTSCIWSGDEMWTWKYPYTFLS